MAEPEFESLRARLAAMPVPAPPAWPHRWSPARMLVHCAQSVDGSLDGYPVHRPAWFQKTIGRLVLARFLSKGAMSHDVTGPIPGLPEPEELTWSDAVARLTKALERFETASSAPAPHFVYGPVTRAEYVRIHAMHVEDHLRAIRNSGA